jgi:hypothetical protein
MLCLTTFPSNENDGCGCVDKMASQMNLKTDGSQDYLSRLSAPKLSVHVGEHVGGGVR